MSESFVVKEQELSQEEKQFLESKNINTEKGLIKLTVNNEDVSEFKQKLGSKLLVTINE